MKQVVKQKMKFIDLFAGIGGFRTAFNNLGLECIYSNDYDKYAVQTYAANFGEIDDTDIHLVNEANIPEFDLLCAGFPCQPFSIAGVSKKNSLGRKHGFEDKKQGNLFFEIIRFVNYHKPKVLFLENVKNLKSHDKGNTWKIIKASLEQAGYSVFMQVVDGKYYVPQHRERVFIICFNKLVYPDISFEFPVIPSRRIYELKDVIQKKVDDKYTLSNKLWKYLQKHKENSRKKGSGFGFGLIDINKDEYTRTLSARYYKDGSEILIKQQGKNPRRLTPSECAMLQGYPKDFKILVSNNQAYKQFGNSVVVPAIQAVGQKILETIKDYEKGLARKRELELFNTYTYAE